jgi:hypothetical protein
MNAPNTSSAPPADISQLKDIHLPHAISDWPMAFGWWILLTLIIISICAGIYLWRYYKIKNANKKAALSLLELKYSQFKSNQNSQVFLQQSNEILKRYCLKQYPAAISLSGLAWTDFLIRHSDKAFFNEDLAFAISQGLYQADCKYNVDDLYTACTSWIKNNKYVEVDAGIEHSTGLSND